MRAVTQRQAEVLRIVAESIDTRGHAPTQQQIGEAMGINKTSVNEHIRALVKKGRLVRESRGAMGLAGEGKAVAQLERECRLLARLVALKIEDPQVLDAAEKVRDKWLAEKSTGHATEATQ